MLTYKLAILRYELVSCYWDWPSLECQRQDQPCARTVRICQNCELISQNCELISQNCEFISQNCEKKSQNCEIKSHNYLVLFFIQWRKRASIELLENKCVEKFNRFNEPNCPERTGSMRRPVRKELVQWAELSGKNWFAEMNRTLHH